MRSRNNTSVTSLRVLLPCANLLQETKPFSVQRSASHLNGITTHSASTPVNSGIQMLSIGLRSYLDGAGAIRGLVIEILEGFSIPTNHPTYWQERPAHILLQRSIACRLSTLRTIGQIANTSTYSQSRSVDLRLLILTSTPFL